MSAQVNLPAPIAAALDEGAALAISISGGKDSQAMALALVALHRERGWTGDLFCITADLGSIEWPETAAHVQKIADLCGVPLVTVARKRGSMVERWVQRGETTQAKDGQGRPWSDANNRFCTSELKRDPIDTYLRRYQHVVCAVGIRAQESDGRDKQPTHLVRKRIVTRTRRAWTWHPIHAWTLLDVLRQCGHTWADLRDRQLAYQSGKTEQALAGWSLHPAYVYGNERLSCQFCVLGSLNDLQNGAKHNPAMLEELIAIEDRFGFTFQGERSLKTFRQAEPAPAPAPAPAPEPQVEQLVELLPRTGKTETAITYLSGAILPETLGARRADFGFLITPFMGNLPARPGVHAHDNGVYTEFQTKGKKRFNAARFLAHLDNWSGVRQRCLFAVAPDVIAPWQAELAGLSSREPWEATLERSAPILPEIRKRGYRAALVAQNGLEDHLDRVPWDDFDVLFLGGGKDPQYVTKDNPLGEWKLSPGAARLTAAARRRGKHVHMGRVNSGIRLAYAQSIGCTSADGTKLAFGPQVHLPKVYRWINDANVGARQLYANCLICHGQMQAWAMQVAQPYHAIAAKHANDTCGHAIRLTPAQQPALAAAA